MVLNEFSHSLEIETTFDHTEGPVYPPVARNDGVMVGRDTLLDAALWHNDFVVCPQSSILEVLTLVVFELPCGRVEKVREDLWVLSLIFYPVVDDGSCWGNAASDDVGKLEDWSVELFGFFGLHALGSGYLPRFLSSPGCGEWKDRIPEVCAAT